MCFEFKFEVACFSVFRLIPFHVIDLKHHQDRIYKVFAGQSKYFFFSWNIGMKTQPVCIQLLCASENREQYELL